MQVDPMKPTLKAPGIKLLEVKYDKPLSNFAFKFNLRRCIELFALTRDGFTISQGKVGWCRLTL